MFWSLLLLVGAIVAIVWIVRGRKPAPAPEPDEQTPAATDWGRQPQAQQPGVGGQVMGGLATGLALGAGVIAAQEIGRHMTDGDRSRHGSDAIDGPHHGGSAADSDLARDAGLGSVGGDDSASWDDAGASFSDDGGSDS